MTACEVRAAGPADHQWRKQTLEAAWGSHLSVSRGQLHDAATLPALVAVHAGKRAGLLTYQITTAGCEIATMNSLVEGQGIGTALLDTLHPIAAAADCRRIWLITTNDNLRALGFYQQRGYEIAAFHRGAMERSRQLKPEIPLIGAHGIPLRDEIELELPLPR